MATSAARSWARERTFHHSQFPAQRLAAEREQSIAVCLPARECAATITPIVQALLGLREAGVLDEVVVVDAASTDSTARLAAAAGATVYQEASLMPEHGRVRGKGDAMWRALSVLDQDLICFLDADISGFQPHFATGLLGPLVCGESRDELAFVKGLYRRPFTVGGVSVPEGGGRVNHLVARPALAIFYPDLAGVRQPLAGEVAARRELLEQLPFTTGYGVETAMLIDVFNRVGLEAMAQVDLDEHSNAHQSLAALTPMAYAVLSVIAGRVALEGRLSSLDSGALLDGPDATEVAVELIERPPMATVRSNGSGR
jgi:glucosyl-3-phosphoglycerate synthase